MRVFVNKTFDRWSRKEGVDDGMLCQAAAEIAEGLWDANLGGSLFKKRVARKGQGKSGGFRTVVAVKAQDRAIFLYGFAKNE